MLQLNAATLCSPLTLMFLCPNRGTHTLHIPSLPISADLPDACASIPSPLHVSMHFCYFKSSSFSSYSKATHHPEHTGNQKGMTACKWQIPYHGSLCHSRRRRMKPSPGLLSRKLLLLIYRQTELDCFKGKMSSSTLSLKTNDQTLIRIKSKEPRYHPSLFPAQFPGSSRESWSSR